MSPSFDIEDFVICCLLTEAEAKRDFESLQRATTEPCRGTEWDSLMSGAPAPNPLGIFKSTSHWGKRFSAFFHWHLRLKASSSHRRSAEEMLLKWAGGSDSIPKAMQRMSCSAYEALRLNSALQSVVHFRPSVAKELACRFQAKTCLDFSGGWGDRLTGFLAAPSVQIIDIVEPRKAAAFSYRRQHELSGSSAALRVFTGAAEDLLPTMDGVYDLILSSPPYFKLETYDTPFSEGYDMQVSQRYHSTEEYLDRFLLPVTLSCLQKLSPVGVLCINLSDNASKKVVICQAFLTKVLDAMSTNFTFVGTFCYQAATNPANRSKLSAGSTVKGEPIYLFGRARRGR